MITRMSTDHETQFEEANLPAKLDRLEELLVGLTEDQMQAAEGQWPNQIPRLPAVIHALRPLVKAADPLVLAPPVLNQTIANLDALVSAFGAFQETGNVEHLAGIDTWTEALIGLVPQWPSSPDLPSVDVQKTAKKFRQSAGQQLRGLKNDFGKAKEEIAAFEGDLVTRTGQWGEEKATLETELRELTSTIEQQRGRLDTALENQQDQFSQEQGRRNEEYRQLTKELEEQTSAIKNNFDRALTETLAGAEEKANSVSEQLDVELVKAQNTNAYIGGVGTAAGYAKEAKAQRKTANGLRWLAIAFGLAAAGFAVWAILHAENETSPSVAVVISKALGSLVFAGLAGYVATQSAHHRLREEQARKRELDLLALPAFIATLPDEEKEDITGQIATKLFVTETSAPHPGEPALTKESISLLKVLLDTLRK
jgi:hypothetical protein